MVSRRVHVGIGAKRDVAVSQTTATPDTPMADSACSVVVAALNEHMRRPYGKMEALTVYTGKEETMKAIPQTYQSNTERAGILWCPSYDHSCGDTLLIGGLSVGTSNPVTGCSHDALDMLSPAGPCERRTEGADDEN